METLGFLLAFVLIIGIAVATGKGLGALAARLTPVGSPKRKLLFGLALALPLLCALYFLICVTSLPGTGQPGDLFEPLPNGYSLQGLSKMPDFATIGTGNSISDDHTVDLTEAIGALAVYGPLVVGRYSHPLSSFDPGPQEPYFLFDTQTRQHQDFPTRELLEARLGHPIQLTETEQFQSQEPSHLAQLRHNRIITWFPIAAVLAAYLLLLLAVTIRRVRP